MEEYKIEYTGRSPYKGKISNVGKQGIAHDPWGEDYADVGAYVHGLGLGEGQNQPAICQNIHNPTIAAMQ